MICVIATIEVAEGRREDFLVAFRQLAPKVLIAPHIREFRKATQSIRSSITLQILQPAI